MMDIIMQTYGHRPMEPDILRVWWMKLQKFDFEVVRSAFDKWLESQKHRPVPADILELCKPKEPYVYKIEKTIDYEHNREKMKEVKDFLNNLQKSTTI